MIRTVIVDDHELIRDGFKKLLSAESDITLAGEAGSGKELFDLLDSVPIDVVVLDINLPGKDGLEVVKDISVQYKEVKTLILSMYPEDRYAKRALKNGAAGYLTKESASEELITAIRKIYENGRYISEQLAIELSYSFDKKRQPEGHEMLSDREYQVLVLLGQGKKVSEIAENICISIHTVNSYRRRLMEKLGLHSTADCIRYAIQNNLVT